MRIAVLNTATGDVDILLLDKRGEEIFESYDDATDFFNTLGYSEHYISWMVIDGKCGELKVKVHPNNVPYIDD